MKLFAFILTTLLLLTPVRAQNNTEIQAFSTIMYLAQGELTDCTEGIQELIDFGYCGFFDRNPDDVKTIIDGFAETEYWVPTSDSWQTASRSMQVKEFAYLDDDNELWYALFYLLDNMVVVDFSPESRLGE